MYFANFPSVYYSLFGEPNKIVLNLLARAQVLKTVEDNAAIYYTYQIKDSDTPDIIASKYYGDPNRAWIILLFNNIVNPYTDWPMPPSVFASFIENKYGSIAAAKSQIQGYIKTITKIDSASGTITSNDYSIDLTTYNALPASQTVVVNQGNGISVTITTTKSIIYAWDFEYNQNESKRQIKILDKQYVAQIEAEMAQIFQ